jgi:hypothetical protein
MEFMTVFNEFLFPVLARFDRGPEIPNFKCLECWTKRAERCINIISFFPNGAIVDSTGKLDRIPARERCAYRMPRFKQYKHAEAGKEVF